MKRDLPKFVCVVAVVAAVTCCLVGQRASAQECYRSTECDGNLLCVDLTCVVAEDLQTTCSQEADCEWTELCDQGVCKRDGVTCTADFGICTFDNDLNECTCDNGVYDGHDSSSDEGDTNNLKTDEELYNQCIEAAAECEAALDLTEVCTEAQLTECTSLYNLLNTFDANCRSDSGTDDIVDIDVDSDPEKYSTTAADLAQCCEKLTAIDNGNAPEALAAGFECFDALSPDDCDGYKACLETNRVSDSVEDNNDDESTDTRAGSTTADADDSGCQFVPNTGTSTPFSLIRALL